MRADMQEEIADWESKIADVEASQDSVWSVGYRFKWLKQMRHSVANRKTELEKFSKLIAASTLTLKQQKSPYHQSRLED